MKLIKKPKRNKGAARKIIIDRRQDKKHMKRHKAKWNDLYPVVDGFRNALNVLGEEVVAIGQNEKVLLNLGEERTFFDKLMMVFAFDYQRYTKAFNDLEEEVVRRKGNLRTIDDVMKYDDMGQRAQAFYDEFVLVMKPTMASLSEVCGVADFNFREAQRIAIDSGQYVKVEEPATEVKAEAGFEA